MESSDRALRRALAVRERGRGKAVPAELKARVRAHAHERRRHGATYQQIGDELGLPMESVRRWSLAGASVSTRTTAVPVQVVAEPRSGISIVSPSGFRLEGLELQDAVAALRALQ
jgi:hypothetical protein